jgi:hypothetical protein
MAGAGPMICAGDHIASKHDPICPLPGAILLTVMQEEKTMSSHLENGQVTWSRRRLMSVLAAAASTSAVLVATTSPVRAEDWEEYRRDDLGFRVEMPDEPEVDMKTEGLDEKIVRVIDAQASDDKEEGLFGVHCTEYREPVSAEQEYRLFRDGMRLGGLAVTRESTLTIGNIVAREFVRESDGINFVHRLLVVDRRTFGISAYGDRDIHNSQEVQRFLRSFTLLKR